MPARPARTALWTRTEPIIPSLDLFDELAGPCAELGFDQFVLHHPAQTGPYGGDVKTFEKIAERAAARRRPRPGRLSWRAPPSPPPAPRPGPTRALPVPPRTTWSRPTRPPPPAP